MAGTITTRISLDGAEDIRKKLEALGAAGEKAFKQIQDAAKKPIVDQAQLDRTKASIGQLATAIQQFGTAGAAATQQVTAGLGEVSAAAEQTGQSLLAAAAKFAAVAAVIGTAIAGIVSSLAKGAGETAQQISDQAAKLGLSIEQWIALRRSIDAAGGSAENFANTMGPLIGRLNALNAELSGKSITTFADGTQVAILSMSKLSNVSKELLADLEKLGVRRDIIDKGALATLQEAARIIDAMPEGAQKAAKGFLFFGAKWKEMVADLVVGAKSVGDAAAEMDNKLRASREMTAEQVKAAKEAADQWEDLAKAIRATKDAIGALFSGGSFARAKWLTDMVDGARELLKTFLQLDEVGRKGFLAGLGDSAAATLFKVLVALGQQLSGIWNDVLVPAGEKLAGIFGSIAEGIQGISASQVAAGFITLTAAAVGLGLALKVVAIALAPISLLLSPLGLAFAAAGVAAAAFWNQISAGAAKAASLIPQELQQIAEAFQKLFAGDFAGFWDQFSTAAVAAFQKISQAAQQDQGMIGKLFRGLQQIIAELPGTILLVANAFIVLGGAATTVANTINRIFGTEFTGTGIATIVILGQMTGAFQLLASAATIAGVGVGILAAAFGPLPIAIGLVVTAIGLCAFALTQLDWNKMGEEATAAWNWVVDGINNVISKIGELAASVGGAIWDAFASAGEAAINFVSDLIDSLIAKIKGAVSAIRGIISGGGEPGSVTPAPGNARGGLIGGRGSGTSDSNLSWVSRGEHIMPARVVRQPGVLAFLEALRRGGGNLRRVLDGMGRFATGGLVTMPALAGGGVGSMSHVTIQFPGLPAISGLRASQSVVDELQRAAAMAQVRSGGRKPSRYT